MHDFIVYLCQPYRIAFIVVMVILGIYDVYERKSYKRKHGVDRPPITFNDIMALVMIPLILFMVMINAMFVISIWTSPEIHDNTSRFFISVVYLGLLVEMLGSSSVAFWAIWSIWKKLD